MSFLEIVFPLVLAILLLDPICPVFKTSNHCCSQFEFSADSTSHYELENGICEQNNVVAGLGNLYMQDIFRIV